MLVGRQQLASYRAVSFHLFVIPINWFYGHKTSGLETVLITIDYEEFW
jgi:hypothetical protein